MITILLYYYITIYKYLYNIICTIYIISRHKAVTLITRETCPPHNNVTAGLTSINKLDMVQPEGTACVFVLVLYCVGSTRSCLLLVQENMK